MTKSAGSSLPRRFADALARHGVLRSGDHLLIALSGGADSTVLLHLLRFGPGLLRSGPSPFRSGESPLRSGDTPLRSGDTPLRYQLSAAHFDHGMRDGSGQDHQWVAGLCRAWNVPLHSGRPPSTPASEEEARDARLAFLQAVREREGADWIITGHHGDDQAETVLFRIARGTGLRGLAGIPRTREPGVYRPLLEFSRKELLEYAGANRISFRQDPTNLELRYARNLLRHRILPELEEGVAPGTRNSLRRLARLARENEDAWDSVMPGLLDGILEEVEDGFRVVRPRLLASDPALQPRLLRAVFRRLGIALDEAGTQAAVEFTRTGVSGGRLHLPGGFAFVREFERFRIVPSSASRDDRPLTIRELSSGTGELRIGGIPYRGRWGPEKMEGSEWETVELTDTRLSFPLICRGWEPGDVIVLAYGSKKLKKLFAEARIPSGSRAEVPVLADSQGRVLWVAGLAVSALVQETGEQKAFFFGVQKVDEN